MGPFLAVVGKFIAAIFIGAGAGASAGYVLAVNIARVGLLALVAKLTAPKLDLTQTAVIKSLTIRDPIAPQAFVYGEDMLSGPIIFSNVAGLDNRDIYILIALTGHEVDSVTKYRIDDEDIPLTDLSGSEDGDVTGGKFSGVARVDFRHGTSTQVVIPSLTSVFPSLFGANHTGRGWSYMLWEFNLIEGQEDVFKTQPGNIRAIVKGKKVYDPRLDDTNGGTGPHRLATPSTWEWSHNPALCLVDFIRDDKFGMKEEDDRIDWPMVITAADVCEELVAIPTAATQERYTCNVTFQATQTRGAVRDELLGSMMGRMVFSQGLWKIWAGEAVVADVTITEANLKGAVQLQASTPSRDRYNRVRGKHIDAARDYTAAAYVEQRSSTFETEDGGEVREIVADFMSTNNDFEAQRKAIITLKQSRNQRVVMFQGNYSCFRIQAGATVDLDIAEYGFAGEKFFVTEWKLAVDGIELTLVEEVDSVWADPAEGDYSVRSETGVLTFGDTGVPAPTAFSGATQDGGFFLQWTNPPASMFAVIEVWASDDNVRGNAVLVATVAGTEYLDQVSNTRTRWYWIRARNTFGEVSDFEPDLTTTTVTGSATGAGLDGDSVFVANVYQRSASAPATPTVDDGQYNFTTNVLTPPAGWSVTPPAGSDPLYVSTGAFSISGPTGTDTTVTWTSPDILVQDGATGAAGDDGISVHVANVYQRSASAPSTPTADDGQYNFTTNVLTPPTGWSVEPPAGSDPLYISTGSFSIVGQTGTDTTVTWTSPDILVQDGDTGVAGGDGNSVFVGSVFLRKASAPTEPIDDDGQYNFTTNVLTPPSIGGGSADNWSITVPAGSDDLYVSAGTFEISGATGTDTTVDWSAPVILASDGADGAGGAAGDDGLSVHVAQVFQRSASAPSTPTVDDGQYNFTTQVLTPPSGWAVEPPAGADPLYVSTGSFSVIGQTGTDTTVTWTAPDLLVQDGADGSAGAAGDDGLSVHVAQVFQRSASAPSTPTADDGQYNFTTQVLTPPTGWAVEPPAGSDPLYVSVGSFSIIGQTGTDTTVVWTSPDILVQDGADGATGSAGGDGDSIFVGSVYLRKASAPTEPIDDDGSYNFTTNVLTPPSITGGSADDWSITVPAGSDDLYISTGSFEINGTTGTDTTVDWTAPVILVSDGISVFVANVFQRSASAPSTPTVDDGQYNFTTQVLTPPSGWSVAPPAGSDPLYVSTGSFSIAGPTGTDTTVIWTAPDLLVQDGATGLSVFVANVYVRAVLAPATPTTDDGQYNFTTNVLTPPATGGWAVEPPAGTDPLWISTGSFSIVGPTGTDTTVVWTAPDLLVQDASIPDFASSFLYDDLDTTELAAGAGRYAMLTARATNTSGDDNNFQDTDGILINQAGTNGEFHNGFLGSLIIGERITYVISPTRWYLYVIDEIFDPVGAGAAKAYKFGVTLVHFRDADPTVTIPTTSGNNVNFEFQRSEAVSDGSLIRDPDFDQSTALGVQATRYNFTWWKIYELIRTDIATDGGISFVSGGGGNSSNAVEFERSTVAWDTTGGFAQENGTLIASVRIRTNIPEFTVKIRWRNESANDFESVTAQMVGYDDPRAGTIKAGPINASLGVLGNAGGATWQETTLIIEGAGDPDAQYWQFNLHWTRNFTSAATLAQVDIDSIFIYSSAGVFSGVDKGAGLVPEAASGDATKVLQGDGAWVANAGGGIPTVITVADESADTTCFPAFFTAATGDLAPKTDASAWTYDASTGDLVATLFAGIANANLLDKTAAETVTVDWTFNSGPTFVGAAGPIISSTTPQLRFFESDAASDTKYWRFLANGGIFSLDVLLDTFSSPVTVFSVSRTATVIDSIDFAADVDVDGALTATTFGGILEGNLVNKGATELISSEWSFSGNLNINGNALFVKNAGLSDWARHLHNGVDYITDFTLTADWEMGSGLTGVILAKAPITTLASATGAAGFNIPEGVAPTAPVDGDIWVTTTDILARINGVSQSLIGGGGGGPPIIFLDNEEERWGTGTDVIVKFDGTDLLWDAVSIGHYTFKDGIFRLDRSTPHLQWYNPGQGTDLKLTSIFVTGSTFTITARTDANAAGDAILTATRGPTTDISAVLLYAQNAATLRTQQHDLAGNTSGATVLDHTGTQRPVGFNDWRVMSEDVADTLEAKHAGGVYFKDGTGAITLTLEASGSTDFPVHAVCQIINAGASGDITVTEGSGVTLWVLTGAEKLDSFGSSLVKSGGFATLWRESTTIYYLMGAGLLP